MRYPELGHKEHQLRLDQLFETEAERWKNVYETEDLRSILERGRLQRAASFTSRAHPGEGGRALDVGCGAGVMATELASRGLRVTAVDTVPRMLELTEERAARVGLGRRVSVARCDARRLPFPSQTYDIVVALGLMSWLDAPVSVLAEMARVCRPGGHVVLTCRNRFRFESLVDPRQWPVVTTVRRWVKRKLRTRDMRAISTLSSLPRARPYAPREFDSMLSSVGLARVAGCTFGFRAPVFLGRPLLPDRFARQLHDRLQALADAEFPFVRVGGHSYVVLAQRQ
jgi:ubiquinone/menaquinone biosynthesis C-methylase UbiE